MHGPANGSITSLSKLSTKVLEYDRFSGGNINEQYGTVRVYTSVATIVVSGYSPRSPLSVIKA